MTTTTVLIVGTLSGLAFSCSALAQIQVPGDLEPTSISLAGRTDLRPGEVITITSTIRNNVGFSSQENRSAYYLSEDSVISTSDYLLDGWTMPPIGALGSYTHTTGVRLSPSRLPAGNCRVAVWVNRSGDMQEFNTTNNILSTGVTCHGLPDLDVFSISVSGNGAWARGEAVSAMSTVVNRGGARANLMAVEWFLERGSNGTTVRDQLLRRLYSTPDPGQAVTVHDTLFMPLGTPLGDCSIGLVVSLVFGPGEELDDTNNQRLTSGTCFLRGAFEPFGAGCQGASGLVPTLTANDPAGDPQIGSTSTYELHDGPASTVCLFAFSLSDSRFGQLPLPLALDGFGAPGCALLTGSEFSTGALTDGSGLGAIFVPFPDNPSLIGVRLFTQVVCPDAGANALGWTFSNGLKMTLGGGL